MTRRRRPRIPSQHHLPGVHLDHVDTSETLGNAVPEQEGPTNYTRSESVPPPFHAGSQESYVKKSDVGLVWKVGAIFLALGVPVIWFAASLSSDIDNVASDVAEMKRKTEGLVERSIRQDERFTALEKSVGAVYKLVQDSRKQKSEKKAP